MMAEPLIWMAGDWQQPDFAAAIAWLNTHAQCIAFCAVDEAITAADTPAAIVVVQSRPGQISRQDVERLHAVAPLARLVALLGPWCEGELRSGRPFPGVARVPWRAWTSRLPRELGIKPSTATVRLPRTATDIERLANSVAMLRRRPARNLTAEICTESRGEFESLRDVLGALSVCAIWRQPEPQAEQSSADVVLIDGWENVEGGDRKPPCILLLHFPRPEDAERAIAAGIAAVLGWPLLLADLAATLDEILPPAAASRESAA